MLSFACVSCSPLARRGLISLFLLFLSSCLADTGQVTLTLDLPSDVEPVRIAVVLLPLDLDGTIDSLSAADGTPRPSFPGLDRDIRGVTPPSMSGLEDLQADWTELRRRVTRLADSLAQASRTDPGYREAYDRLRSLYGEVVRREAALEERLDGLVNSEQADVARRAAQGSDSLRRWESDILAELSSILTSESQRGNRRPVLLEVPEEMVAPLRIEPGKWWAVIRARHPNNPFLEYYWNVPFVVNRLVPVVVPLGAQNMVTRWRH